MNDESLPETRGSAPTLEDLRAMYIGAWALMPAGVLAAIVLLLWLSRSDVAGAIVVLVFSPAPIVLIGIGVVARMWILAKSLDAEERQAFHRFLQFSVLWAPPLALLSCLCAMLGLACLAALIP